MNARLREAGARPARLRQCQNGEVADLLTQCAELPRRTVEVGESIIDQGGTGGSVFVLVDGSVAIERDDARLAVLDTPGALLGEMSTVLQQPSSASVVALTEVTVLEAVDGTAFLAEHPDVMLEVARTLATRLDHLTAHVVEVKRQYGGESSHLGMLDEVLSTLMHHQARQVSPGSARMPETDY